MGAVHQESHGCRERILAREGAAGVSAAHCELPRGMGGCVLKQQDLRDGLLEIWHPPDSAEMERRYVSAQRAMARGQMPRKKEVAGQPADGEAIRACIGRCPAQESEAQVRERMVKGGGTEAIVAMLKASEVGVAHNVLSYMELREPALAEVVRQAVNPFEELAGWSDRALQGLLCRMDRSELAKALHWVSELLRERLLSNTSPRARYFLREEMDRLGAVPRSAAREAQDRLLRQISLWRETGERIIR